ncbi:hypothetical protein QCA50_009066 [Cerrena zonata]|uniref:Uncharacterized protein n=1 Tax=Cerrena zonata TaxID=2478898 RepID=A0AAW0G632_9APHY
MSIQFSHYPVFVKASKTSVHRNSVYGQTIQFFVLTPPCQLGPAELACSASADTISTEAALPSVDERQGTKQELKNALHGKCDLTKHIVMLKIYTPETNILYDIQLSNLTSSVQHSVFTPRRPEDCRRYGSRAIKLCRL